MNISDEIKELREEVQRLRDKAIQIEIDELIEERISRLEKQMRWHGLDDMSL